MIRWQNLNTENAPKEIVDSVHASFETCYECGTKKCLHVYELCSH